MINIKTAISLLIKNRRVFLYAVFDKMNKEGLLHWLSDSIFLRINYWLIFGKKLNLKTPKTFNEKLQWLKLYDRRPEYITMVDKIAVKDYVAERIGKEYIIPTLGVWQKPEDIDWDSLPNQFVLKWNHDSKSIVICKDKKVLNRNTAISKLRYGERINGFWYGREWPYKGVEPKIIAEKYISQNDSAHQDLTDYKFFCFNGVPKYVQVIQDRSTKETIDFFDINWIHQEFIGLNNNAVPADKTPRRPDNFCEMICMAKELSKGLTFSRIDMYCVEKHVYFGEITFYPASGFGLFRPDEWNYKMGNWITLPKQNK